MPMYVQGVHNAVPLLEGPFSDPSTLKAGVRAKFSCRFLSKTRIHGRHGHETIILIRQIRTYWEVEVLVESTFLATIVVESIDVLGVEGFMRQSFQKAVFKFKYIKNYSAIDKDARSLALCSLALPRVPWLAGLGHLHDTRAGPHYKP